MTTIETPANDLDVQRSRFGGIDHYRFVFQFRKPGQEDRRMEYDSSLNVCLPDDYERVDSRSDVTADVIQAATDHVVDELEADGVEIETVLKIEVVENTTIRQVPMDKRPD